MYPAANHVPRAARTPYMQGVCASVACPLRSPRPSEMRVGVGYFRLLLVTLGYFQLLSVACHLREGRRRCGWVSVTFGYFQLLSVACRLRPPTDGQRPSEMRVGARQGATPLGPSPHRTPVATTLHACSPGHTHQGAP
jgi:hypothetical protein